MAHARQRQSLEVVQAGWLRDGDGRQRPQNSKHRRKKKDLVHACALQCGYSLFNDSVHFCVFFGLEFVCVCVFPLFLLRMARFLVNFV